MNKKLILPILAALILFGGLAFTLVNSTSEDTTSNSSTEEDHAHNEDGSHISGDFDFIDGAIVSSVSTDCTLTDGSSSECSEITIAGIPADYEIGPFCPATIDALAADAGVWLDGENFYDADGEFILNLAEIYNDDNWKLYNEDGTVNITDTAEAFDAAARPDVDPAYQNYCVEGQIAWLDGGEPIQSTVLIPTAPVLANTSAQVGATVGITLGGVTIDPSAPVDAILSAYTIATFDDCGGHVNPVAGYHLHAATGCSEVGEVEEGETKPFAIAMDGFYIHSPYASGEEPADLDECNGHTTDELGYHYHANSPEKNAVLTCFMGETEESVASNVGGGGGGPPAGGPPAR